MLHTLIQIIVNHFVSITSQTLKVKFFLFIYFVFLPLTRVVLTGLPVDAMLTMTLSFVRADTKMQRGVPSEQENTLRRVDSTLALRLFVQLSLSTTSFA